MTSTRARSDPGQPIQSHASLPTRAIVDLVAVYSAALALLATLLLDDSNSGDSNSGDSSSDSGASDLADSSADCGSDSGGSDSSGGTGHAEQTAARAARRHARRHAGEPDAADVPPPTGGLEG
jgi:hypothetical protein